MLLDILDARFGALPGSVVERVKQMDEDRCRQLARRSVQAASLTDLGLE